MMALKGETLKLWLYLNKNQSGFQLELSQKACEQWGIKKDAYYTARKKLIELGFLVPKAEGSNIYIFYEVAKPSEKPKDSNVSEKPKPALSEKPKDFSENQKEPSEKPKNLSEFQQRNTINTINTINTTENAHTTIPTWKSKPEMKYPKVKKEEVETFPKRFTLLDEQRKHCLDIYNQGIIYEIED